jgi:DNA polymerase-3 subunit delta
VKIDARKLPGLLRDPAAFRVALLHGEDAGLIRDRAETLVRNVAGSLDDPFLVTELAGREGLARLPEEADSLSMTGGRRVIRLRDATDSAAPAVQAILAGKGAALVVLEAASLPTRSKLRAVVEAAANGAAIPCYPEEGDALETTIRSVLGELDAKADAEAVTWLAGQLGGDRASTRRELEKLAIYAGPGGTVDLDAAAACIGDMAGLSLEDAVFAATAGDVDMTDRALEIAMGEGAAPVQVLRVTLGHIQRVQRVRAAMADGAAMDEAMRTLRPPVFFKRAGAFKRALALWSLPALSASAAALSEAESACKRTGSPDVTLCRAALLTVARRARFMARR